MNAKRLTAASLTLPTGTMPEALARDLSATHDALWQALSDAEFAEARAARMRRTADALTVRYDALVQEATGQGRLELDDHQ